VGDPHTHATRQTPHESSGAPPTPGQGGSMLPVGDEHNRGITGNVLLPGGKRSNEGSPSSPPKASATSSACAECVIA
jgi:hypothetical protein